MKTITDASYGAVPVIQDASGVWRVLLVHQISHRGGEHRFWIFPKGHAEGEEKPQEAARRELREETGVTEAKLETDTEFKIEYSFMHEGVKVEKTVTYYLAYCQSEETSLTQPKEILDIQWFSFAEAAEKLTHKNSKEVLRKAEEFLVNS